MADPEQVIRDRWDKSCDESSEQRSRMLEDLRFSNPTDPQQWDAAVRDARERDASGARPTMTFDKTNERIAQVVNDARMNKPQIEIIPANSGADEKVADVLNGLIRQIEYTSSAAIAYDTAIEHAARVGLGWFRVVPRVMDPKLNYQEIRIERIHDCMSVKHDSFTMPDGSDQRWGFVESLLPESEYLRRYHGGKKKKLSSWFGEKGDAGWYGDGKVRVVEYFEVEESSDPRLIVGDGENEEDDLSEEEYEKDKADKGYERAVKRSYSKVSRKVRWSKLDGNGYLKGGEPTDFPSKWIPLVPVIGYELWIEGKRYLCGMVRRMMDGQRAYNLSRSAEIEVIGKQPKTPYMVDWQSISAPDHQRAWAEANQGNPLWLPYDSRSPDGEQLAAPTRVQPPSLGNGFGILSQQALGDIDSSIGQYQANRGEKSNESSGVAIKRREQQGDTANFHYIDNLTRSITHAGRIVVDMIPQIYDQKRQARILGFDGKSEVVTINPGQKPPAKMNGRKVESIRVDANEYDVRCKVGPAYASLREEAAVGMEQIIRAFPAFAPVLGPMWAQMQDWPQAEKASKLMLAMAPPQIQALENDETDIPPQVIAQLEQMKQQMAQMGQQMQAMDQSGAQLAQQLQEAQNALKNKDAETQIKARELELKEAEAIHRMNTPEAEPQILPTEMAEAELKQAQAVKTLADAEKTRVETIQLAAGLQEQGIGTEVDPESGDVLPSPMERVIQQVAELTQFVVASQAQAAALAAAPRTLVRDPLTNQIIGSETVIG